MANSFAKPIFSMGIPVIIDLGAIDKKSGPIDPDRQVTATPLQVEFTLATRRLHFLLDYLKGNFPFGLVVGCIRFRTREKQYCCQHSD